LLDTRHSTRQAQAWLTPKDLQRELQIGEKLAYRLLKNGAIPSVRVGGLIRIHRLQLEEALLKNPDLETKGKGPVVADPRRDEPLTATKGVRNDNTRIRR
jgi:excisionase family DNA binding protein